MQRKICIYLFIANDGIGPAITTSEVKRLRCLRLHKAEPKTELGTDEGFDCGGSGVPHTCKEWLVKVTKPKLLSLPTLEERQPFEG